MQRGRNSGVLSNFHKTGGRAFLATAAITLGALGVSESRYQEPFPLLSAAPIHALPQDVCTGQPSYASPTELRYRSSIAQRSAPHTLQVSCELADEVSTLLQRNAGEVAMFGNAFTQSPRSEYRFYFSDDPQPFHVVQKRDVGNNWEARRYANQFTRNTEEETGRNVVFNSGRIEYFTPQIETYGRLAQVGMDIFASNGVPEMMYAITIPESGWVPTRSSGQAVGFTQFDFDNNWHLKEFLEDDDRKHPASYQFRDFITQLHASSAALNVLHKLSMYDGTNERKFEHGSWLVAASMYQTGKTRAQLAVTDGSEIADSLHLANDPLSHWLVGREVTRRVSRQFGAQSSSYPFQVVGPMLALDSVLETIPQLPLYRYQTDEAITKQDLAQQTGVPIETISMMNPYRIVPTSFVHLPIHAQIGREDITTPTIALLKEWEAFKPQRWDASIQDSLLHFSDRFGEAGNIYMQWAIMQFGMPSERLPRIVARHTNNWRRNAVLQQQVEEMRNQQ